MQLTAKLMQHQQAALDQCDGARSFAYLMEPRTGKTLTTLEDAGRLHAAGKINGLVVVAPKGVVKDDVWGQELQNRYELDDSVWTHIYRGGTTKREARDLRNLFQLHPQQLPILFIHWEAALTDRGFRYLERFLTERRCMLVLDEAHRMKTPSAKRTRHVTRLGKLARYRRILTGSLLANSPLDVYGPFNFLDPAILGQSNFFSFKQRYAVLERKRYGNRPSFNEVVGYQHLDELRAKIAPYSYSVTVAECFDLPPRQYLRVAVDLSPTQHRLYEQLKEEFITELDGGTMTAALAITRLLRLHQLLGGTYTDDGGSIHYTDNGALTPRDESLLEHVAEAQGKLIVWSKYIQERIRLIDVLAPVKGNDWRRIYTDAQVGEFKADAQPCILLASPEGPASEGVDLSCADTMIYYSNSHKLTARIQSEARCENVKLKRPVQIIDLVAPGTVDEKILERLQAKKDLARSFSGAELRRWLT